MSADFLKAAYASLSRFELFFTTTEHQLNKEELKEWFGIKPADFAVYAAAAGIYGMYVSGNFIVDIVLSTLVLALCLVACVVGMRAVPGLSSITNAFKKFAYPICLIAALAFIYQNFSSWNSRHATTTTESTQAVSPSFQRTAFGGRLIPLGFT